MTLADRSLTDGTNRQQGRTTGRPTTGRPERLRLDEGTNQELVQRIGGQGARQTEKVVLDHVEDIILEAGIVGQAAFPAVGCPQLLGPVGQALHGREDPVGQVQLFVFYLKHSQNVTKFAQKLN